MSQLTKINYDELSDTLAISFQPGVKATGIELTQNILLRMTLGDFQPASLVFFDYSILAQKTEVGDRSFPLTLTGLSGDLQASVISVLQSPPVNEYLHLSAYTVSIIETIPIVSLQPKLVATVR